jgi:hypothetical protein
MRQVSTARRILLAAAAARIPAPVTTAIQLPAGFGQAMRPALPRDGQVAQIAPAQTD